MSRRPAIGRKALAGAQWWQLGSEPALRAGVLKVDGMAWLEIESSLFVQDMMMLYDVE